MGSQILKLSSGVEARGARLAVFHIQDARIINFRYIDKFSPAHLVFEKSATYFDNPMVPSQVVALVPQVKVAVILHDPSLRAYSWFQVGCFCFFLLNIWARTTIFQKFHFSTCWHTTTRWPWKLALLRLFWTRKKAAIWGSCAQDVFLVAGIWFIFSYRLYFLLIFVEWSNFWFLCKLKNSVFTFAQIYSPLGSLVGAFPYVSTGVCRRRTVEIWAWWRHEWGRRKIINCFMSLCSM